MIFFPTLKSQLYHNVALRILILPVKASTLTAQLPTKNNPHPISAAYNTSLFLPPTFTRQKTGHDMGTRRTAPKFLILSVVLFVGTCPEFIIPHLFFFSNIFGYRGLHTTKAKSVTLGKVLHSLLYWFTLCVFR